MITPVEGALSRLDDRFDDMASAGRGELLILRGETGGGKSTFLDTVGLFRAGAVAHRIPPDADVQALGVYKVDLAPQRGWSCSGRDRFGSQCT